LTQKKNLTW